MTATFPAEHKTRPPGDATSQRILNIHWCPTCRRWTLATQHGYCLWHEPPLRITESIHADRLRAYNQTRAA